jgi:hypothetical protein
VRRAVDLFILAVWVVCCGLTIDLAVVSHTRESLVLSLFAGAGLGWYWRGSKS